MRFTSSWSGGALAACLLAVGAGPALAQEVRSETTTQVRKVSVVLGAALQLQGGAGFGKIEDIVINDNGCIEYIVVSHESQYVVVPWSAATVNFEQRTVSVNVTQEKLREVTFTRDRWPTLARAAASRARPPTGRGRRKASRAPGRPTGSARRRRSPANSGHRRPSRASRNRRTGSGRPRPSPASRDRRRRNRVSRASRGRPRPIRTAARRNGASNRAGRKTRRGPRRQTSGRRSDRKLDRN
jgi:hypothetical protein